MRTARVLIGLWLVVAACGSDADEHRSDGVARYRFDGDGITGRLLLQGTEGSLLVTNASSEIAGPPGVYSLDALTGTRADAIVSPPLTAIRPGETVRFRVSFEDDFDLEASGFVGLELGGEDAGGFSQE
jgi:hypothetical protein